MRFDCVGRPTQEIRVYFQKNSSGFLVPLNFFRNLWRPLHRDSGFTTGVHASSPSLSKMIRPFARRVTSAGRVVHRRSAPSLFTTATYGGVHRFDLAARAFEKSRHLSAHVTNVHASVPFHRQEATPPSTIVRRDGSPRGVSIGVPESNWQWCTGGRV